MDKRYNYSKSYIISKLNLKLCHGTMGGKGGIYRETLGYHLRQRSYILAIWMECFGHKLTVEEAVERYWARVEEYRSPEDRGYSY